MCDSYHIPPAAGASIAGNAGSALVERIVVHDRSDVLVRVESLQQLQTLLEGHLLPKRSTEEQKPEKKMNE